MKRAIDALLQKEWFVTLAVNASRLLLAAAFLFSGFAKAVDPLGSFYKLKDYAEALSLSSLLPDWFTILGALVLAVVEFCVGAFLLLGVRRRMTTWTGWLIMCVMLPLTLWLALANPVADCGCFGDAWILTNWQTFGKNVLLWIAAFIVFRAPRRIIRLIAEPVEWMVSLYTLCFAWGIAIYCLFHLPIIDFRPYRIGTDIPASMQMPADAKPSVLETRFVLEKEGKRREFTLENYPDSTWIFIESRTIVKEKGYEPPIHDFSLVDAESGKDLTDSVLDNPGYTFLLVAHRVEEADDSGIDLINELYDYCVENGYGFLGLTSSPDDEIERWRDRTGAEYPFCLADDITLKTIIRSNPGLLLLRKGVILNKWSNNDLPDEYQLAGRLEQLEIGRQKSVDDRMTLLYVLLCYAVPVIVVALAGKGGKAMLRRTKKETKIVKN